MATYSENRKYADTFIPQIKRIVGPLLLEPTDVILDTREATDLIVFHARDMRIAARVRRHGYFEKYGHQFTIRARLDNGMETELSKIVNGWGDWLFYGHSDPSSTYIKQWMVVDLHSFRAALIRNSMNGARIKIEERANGDGTFFKAFDVKTFPVHPPILVTACPAIEAMLPPQPRDDTWDQMWARPFDYSKLKAGE